MSSFTLLIKMFLLTAAPHVLLSLTMSLLPDPRPPSTSDISADVEMPRRRARGAGGLGTRLCAGAHGRGGEDRGSGIVQ